MEERSSNKISIDFLNLLRAVRADKKMMALYLVLAAILGLCVAFGTPKEYKSSVMLAPETSSSNSLTSNISSLASMVGMDMDFGKSNDAIYPELYPELFESPEFIVGLYGIKVTTKDHELTTDYYTYMKNHQQKIIMLSPMKTDIISLKKVMKRKKNQ